MTKAERGAALQAVAQGQTIRVYWPMEWRERRKVYNYSHGTVLKVDTLNGEPLVLLDITEGFGSGRKVSVAPWAEFTGIEVMG